MSNPKGRQLPGIFSMYLLVLAVYYLDIFFFKSDLTVLGEVFYSSLLGLAVLFLYVEAEKSKLKSLGISKSTQKMTVGFVSGSIISLVPFLAVLLAEMVLNGSARLRLMPPNLANINLDGNLPPIVAVLIYVVTVFIAAFYKELFFRGLMLKQMKKATSFKKANSVQALLYTAFFLAMPIRKAAESYSETPSLKVVLLAVAVFAAVGFISAVKWGMITRVEGTVYASVADHFIFSFITNSVFIRENYGLLYSAVRAAAIQLLSFAVVFVYYQYTMKKVKETNLKRQEIRERARREKEKNKPAEKLDINAKTENIDEISPLDFKSISGTRRLSDDEILQGEKRLKSALTASSGGDGTELSDRDVDSLLRDLNVALAPKKHRSKRESTKITEDFDTDEFLEHYGHRSEHHHHTHHNSQSVKPKAAPHPKKEKSAPEKQPKKTLWQALNSVGAVDDSSSNELL